jgi:hypothetical protein
MTFPTQISFHGMEREPSIEGKIRDRIQRLVRLSSEIMGCRVVVEYPDKVHVVVRLPRTMLSVTKGERNTGEQLSLEVSVRDAFDAAERALGEFRRQRAGAVPAR